ncbi:hypothetical protein B0A53_04192 [Rhodotorula sp. CCFEE 5036]|nr:hypothetical protein B0A53_04192 [Rhodotorula sp. CCFEE 5036]
MSTGPAEHAEAAVYPMLNFSSGSSSVLLAPVCTSWGAVLTTTLTPEEQRAEWEREQAQTEPAGGAAQEQSGEAATTDDAEAGDKKLESGEDGEAGKDKDAAATAAEAGQSDRTSGAYRVL